MNVNITINTIVHKLFDNLGKRYSFEVYLSKIRKLL
jgi:hypothetical protein